jgi:uncharacterized membrane protein YhhN
LWIVAKPLPVLALAAWTLRGRRSRYVAGIATGLVLSAVGDVLLELGPSAFVPGMAAFALAHVAYIVTFLADASAPRLALALPFAAWGAGLLTLLLPGLGPLTGPVAGYAVVLMVMIWRASARVGSRGAATRGEWGAAVGAVLFGLSDSLLAFDRFRGPMGAASLAILPLYWLGQAGIAASTRDRDYS